MSRHSPRFVTRTLHSNYSRGIFAIWLICSISAMLYGQEAIAAAAEYAYPSVDPSTPSNLAVILAALILATGFVVGAWILRRKS